MIGLCCTEITIYAANIVIVTSQSCTCQPSNGERSIKHNFITVSFTHYNMCFFSLYSTWKSLAEKFILSRWMLQEGLLPRRLADEDSLAACLKRQQGVVNLPREEDVCCIERIPANIFIFTEFLIIITCFFWFFS
jgi:hypothetical protein